MRKNIILICIAVVSFFLFIVPTVAQEEKGMGDDMGAMMDSNSDGKVSKEEFLNHKEEMFLKMDQNNDGLLDKEERKKMMKMCMHCRQMMMGEGGKMSEKDMRDCPMMKKMKGKGMMEKWGKRNMGQGNSGMKQKVEKQDSEQSGDTL